ERGTGYPSISSIPLSGLSGFGGDRNPSAPASWKTATSVRGPDWGTASRTHFGAYEEGSSGLKFRSSRLPKESSRAYSGLLSHELAGQRPVARAKLMLAMSLSLVRAPG